jgi:hypothetical protein
MSAESHTAPGTTGIGIFRTKAKKNRRTPVREAEFGRRPEKQ